MTITLRPGTTVMFTGDSITDLWRPDGEDRCGYPLRIAGEWCFRHPDRPITWLNTGNAGDKVSDLEARWQADVLDAHPDLVSILVGVNDNSWHTLDPSGHEISADEFAAGYDRLLASLAGTGTEIILIEPFLLPVRGVVEAGIHRDGESGAMLIDDDVRRAWRTSLNPKIAAVRQLAVEYGTHLLAADGMFAGLAARTGPLVRRRGAPDPGRPRRTRGCLATPGGLIYRLTHALRTSEVRSASVWWCRRS